MNNITFERLAGATSRFAVKIAFEGDPDQGAGATAEETASWGSFQLWVGGQNLCAFADGGDTISSCHWYLLGLLEWLVEMWDPLFHEERLPIENLRATASDDLRALNRAVAPDAPLDMRTDQARYLWWRRHSLQAARNGGLFPDVCIRRYRDDIEFSWSDSLVAGAPPGFRFLASNGSYRLPAQHVVEPLFEVLESACSELQRRVPHSKRIASLWRALTNLNTESYSVHRRRAALLAGVHLVTWNRIEQKARAQLDDWEGALVGTLERSLFTSSPTNVALMFGSVSPTVTEPDIAALLDVLLRGGKGPKRHPASLQLEALAASMAESSATETPPWTHGVVLAEAVGGLAGEFVGESVDIAGILEHLGVAVGVLSLSDETVRAVSLVSDTHHPTICINVRYSDGTSEQVIRFSYAHELCHLLIDRSRGRRLAIASGAWAPVDVEQRANAFAAALLMPADRVERISSERRFTADALVDAVSQRLNTSKRSTIDRLFNLGYLTRHIRDRIRYPHDAPAARPAPRGELGELP